MICLSKGKNAMNITLVNCIVVILLGILFSSIGNSEKNKTYYIVFVLFWLLLETALRGLSVGSDTRSYYEMFENTCRTEWSDIFNMFFSTYRDKANEDDIGFVLLQKIISIFTYNWSVFVFISDLLFYIPFGILLYRYCKTFWHLTIALLIFVCLFQIIPLSGGRQLQAMGLCIISFMYLDKEKYRQAIIFVLIGALIHKSCLLCLLPIVLSKLKPNVIKTVHILSILAIPVALSNINQFIVFLGESIGSEKYANYGRGFIQGDAVTFLILLELVSLFCLIGVKRNDLANDKTLLKLYTMVPCFTIFATMIYSNGSMIRVSMYFHLYIMMLIPYTIDLFFKKGNKTIYFIFVALLLFFALTSTGVKYYFLWNDPYSVSY